MSILPPSARVGEPVILPGAPKDFSLEVEGGWALVKEGRLWKTEAETPLTGPLFSASGEEIAPNLEIARGVTDATLLKGEKSEREVREWAEKMQELNPRTVCVFPAFLGQVKDLFANPAVVISFPHGADSTSSKVVQIEEALGAGELDVVAPLYLIAGERWPEFAREMRALAPYRVKLILETSLWSKEQILRASKEALDAGIWCLKTSTGSLGGASASAVSLMKKAGATEIKASGGIRSRLIAGEMLSAGATMLGSSNLETWV